MVFSKIFEKVTLGVMSLVMLLQVWLSEEEFGAVTTLDNVLLLIRGQSHKVFICA